jgi:hypothetical protein
VQQCGWCPYQSDCIAVTGNPSTTCSARLTDPDFCPTIGSVTPTQFDLNETAPQSVQVTVRGGNFPEALAFESSNEYTCQFAATAAGDGALSFSAVFVSAVVINCVVTEELWSDASTDAAATTDGVVQRYFALLLNGVSVVAGAAGSTAMQLFSCDALSRNDNKEMDCARCVPNPPPLPIPCPTSSLALIATGGTPWWNGNQPQP